MPIRHVLGRVLLRLVYAKIQTKINTFVQRVKKIVHGSCGRMNQVMCLNKIIPPKSKIIITNLTGISTSTHPFLTLSNVTPVSSYANPRTIFGSTALNPKTYSTGNWNKNDSTLTLTVSNNEQILANKEIKFTFTVELKSTSPLFGISPIINLVSGDGKYEVIPVDVGTIFTRKKNSVLN
jgi:hypothetical protein